MGRLPPSGIRNSREQHSLLGQLGWLAALAETLCAHCPGQRTAFLSTDRPVDNATASPHSPADATLPSFLFLAQEAVCHLQLTSNSLSTEQSNNVISDFHMNCQAAHTALCLVMLTRPILTHVGALEGLLFIQGKLYSVHKARKGTIGGGNIQQNEC